MSQKDDLAALADRIAEATKNWPHGFVHPTRGSDPAFDRIVRGYDPRDTCDQCRNVESA